MKILNATLFQRIGGVETMFRNYDQALQMSGKDFDLLISAQGMQNYQSFGPKACFKVGHKAVIFDFLKLLAITSFCKHEIIICHQPRLMRWAAIISKISRKISKITKTKSIKSVAVVHGMGIKMALNCDYVIAVNSEIGGMIAAQGFNPNKIFVLANAIEINQEYKPKSISKNKRLTIGTYGRIEHGKGFDILLEAGKFLREMGIDFRLKIGGIIVNEGYSDKDLRQIAKQNGILDSYDFVGEVSNKKSFFEEIDIFCVPSRHESFGLVILDGFLFSTPVISSATDGGRILIKHLENGLLFELENAQDLAQKIADIFYQKTDYQKLSKAAYLRLVEEFSLPIFAKNLDKILQKISDDEI